MIGIIAGEIIGSPYGKENIPDINRIFFPLYEDNRVIDPKTYRERNYKAAPGRITDAVLKLSDDVESFTVSKPDKGEAMCQAIVIGRTADGTDEPSQAGGCVRDAQGTARAGP